MESKELTPLKEILQLPPPPTKTQSQSEQQPNREQSEKANKQQTWENYSEKQNSEIKGTKGEPYQNEKGEWVYNYTITDDKGRIKQYILPYLKNRDAKYKAYEEKTRKDEEAQRQQRIQSLIKTAKIPKRFKNIRAEDFVTTDNNRETVKLALESILNNEGLFIYGACGTGKTMLTSIIINERANRNKASTFICATDIFNELNPFVNEDSRIARTKRQLIKNAPCLVIDDLGAEKTSEWTNTTLFDIINYRYNENLQTIITSNFSLDEIGHRVNGYEGERLIRRIKAICKVTELKPY